jgi:hypothetical protein
MLSIITVFITIATIAEIYRKSNAKIFIVNQC